MAELSSMTATVHGKVQGVYYRAFTTRVAKAMGLKGYVRNIPNSGSVEVCAEGDKSKLEELARQLEGGPPEALVDSVEVTWSDFTGQYVSFDVR